MREDKHPSDHPQLRTGILPVSKQKSLLAQALPLRLRTPRGYAKLG